MRNIKEPFSVFPQKAVTSVLWSNLWAFVFRLNSSFGNFKEKINTVEPQCFFWVYTGRNTTMVSFWFNSNFKETLSKNEDDLYSIFNKYPNHIQFDPRETESVSPEIARTWTTERFKSTLLESISQLFPLLVFYAKFYIMQDIVAESNAITHLICIFYVEVGQNYFA